MADFEYADVSEDELVADLRVEICGRVGTNQSNYATTGLTKRTLNSLVAYLCGSFVVEPKRLHTESAPPKSEMMEKVAELCELESWAEKYGAWQRDGCWVDEDDEEHTSLPQFTKDDLREILNEMEESGDSRSWT